jgi:protoheme IX farnesyltransferase
MERPMSLPPTPNAVAGAVERAEAEKTVRQSLLGAHLVLGKVRLNALVVFTTALGFVLGSKLNEFPVAEHRPAAFDWGRLAAVCIGTFLTAVGVSAFNQAVEAPRDARMWRTRLRPLVTGRLSRTYATSVGIIASICGVVVLAWLINALTAALAAGNVLLYMAVYTPLKPRTTKNTLVGAIVGGVPPVLGWSAATGAVAPGAWVLGAILFAWQIPHFLALSWLYREDYARGGFKMLPVSDEGEGGGRMTGGVAALYAALLMPLCVMVALLGHAGAAFVVIGSVLSLGLTVMAVRFARRRTEGDARRLFFASIVYLPVLCAVLMIDARGPLSGYEETPAGYRLAEGAEEEFIDPSGPEAARINAELARQAAATQAGGGMGPAIDTAATATRGSSAREP